MTRTPEQKLTLDEALKRGVSNEDDEMMRLSLEKGADPDLLITATNSKGTLSRLDAGLLQLALKKGADADLLLFAGIERECLPVVKLAVEQGKANVNCTHTAPGKTDTYPVAEWSYRKFNEQISDYLIAKGMNVDMPSPDGVTPLLRAVNDRSYAKTMHYLKHGANPFAADAKGIFALQALQHSSSSSYNTFSEKKDEMLKAMLRNVPDDDGSAGPAKPAATFNAVATGEDIEISKPIELKVKPPAPERPAKGFTL